MARGVLSWSVCMKYAVALPAGAATTIWIGRISLDLGSRPPPLVPVGGGFVPVNAIQSKSAGNRRRTTFRLDLLLQSAAIERIYSVRVVQVLQRFRLFCNCKRRHHNQRACEHRHYRFPQQINHTAPKYFHMEIILSMKGALESIELSQHVWRRSCSEKATSAACRARRFMTSPSHKPYKFGQIAQSVRFGTFQTGI